MTRSCNSARIAFVSSAGLLVAACGSLRLGIVGHAGPVAADTWHLYVVVGAVLVFVAGPVLLLVPLFAWHYRLSNKHAAYKPDWAFAWWIEGLIWLPPIGIVVGLGILLWSYTHRLDPYRPLAGHGRPLMVQAIGFDWKWLFVYPDQRVAAVDQLAIPVGRPVRIELTSATVMQSMLVPQLAGQIYAMAGMRTVLNLAASKPGIYRGENTQFNGAGFQGQKFDVVALDPAGYAAWMARVRAAARPLDAKALDGLFTRSTPERPIFYSDAARGTFAAVMARAQEPRR